MVFTKHLELMEDLCSALDGVFYRGCYSKTTTACVEYNHVKGQSSWNKNFFWFIRGMKKYEGDYSI